MSYTPAEISLASGGDVFYFDYAHADVVATSSFGAGSWGLYKATDLSVGRTITPLVGKDGITSLPGNMVFSVTTAHLDILASSHVEWVGTGVKMEYTLDGGVTWKALTQDIVLPTTSTTDLDIRATFAGGVANDTSELNSLTVYVLAVGATTSSSGRRILTFGKATISDDGLVTLGNESISVVPTSTATAVRDRPVLGPPPTTVSSIELRAAVGTLDAIISGDSFSVSLDGTGKVTATGCTVFVNGVAYAGAPGVVTGSTPYSFVIVPTAPVNEKLTLGASLTISNLAMYGYALTESSAFDLYVSDVEGIPTIFVNDSTVITVTEYDPAVQVYAYAWSVVAGNTT